MKGFLLLRETLDFHKRKIELNWEIEWNMKWNEVWNGMEYEQCNEVEYEKLNWMEYEAKRKHPPPFPLYYSQTHWHSRYSSDTHTMQRSSRTVLWTSDCHLWEEAGARWINPCAAKEVSWLAALVYVTFPWHHLACSADVQQTAVNQCQ